MQNLLLVGSDAGVNQQYLDDLIVKQGYLLSNVFRFNTEPAEFGVESFREILKLAQRQLSTPTLFIIDNFEEISDIIQNSFLKTLEEHQENLHFVLITSSLTKTLPTIRSRCQVVQIRGKAEALETADLDFFRDLVSKLETNPQLLVSTQVSLGMKNKKEKVKALLEKFLLFSHSELPKTSRASNLARYTQRAIELRFQIDNNNLDPEMALDQVFMP